MRDVVKRQYWPLNEKKTLWNVIPVFATSGCPYDCESCSVTEFYGRKLRHRPVHDVIEDIRKNPKKYVHVSLF